MLTVGLTGGIGSGKSEVVRLLAGYGAEVIDADLLAREVVAPGTRGLAEVVAEFGKKVLTEDGTLDRERLGGIVFADPAARQALNAIVHPLVRERAAQLQERAARRDPDAVIVQDVPLLVENELFDLYDVVLVVDAAEEAQLDRLVRLRGMPEADARARMAAQAGRAERLAHADQVVDNSGSLEDLEQRVAETWQWLHARVSRDR